MNDGEILTNAEFDYPFGGKSFKLKKASLQLVILFQRKAAEIGKENDPAGDLRIAAHALYLALHNADTTVTEEWVTENAPGDINVLEVLGQLGFLNQQKVALMNKMTDSLVNQSLNPSQPTGENSSVS